MSNVKDFLKRKDIVITPQRYLIEALGAMAQGLFASLLIGTIIKTLGQQTGLETLVDLGGYATAMSGPAMAVAIGWALHCPPLVLFSLVTVGYSSNALGGAGGPLAVLIIAIVAAVLVVLAGAVYALSGSDDSAKPAPAAQQQAETPAPKTYDGVEVTANFTADCWLEVKADGKVVYEGTLKKGDSQTWKGTDKVTVRVGDAGAVSFSVNGKDLGTAGKTGQVANKTFTKDGN